MNQPTEPVFQLWVDGDACPQVIKAILFKTAQKRQVNLTVVANNTIRIPNCEYINAITVPYGADAADKRIVELMNSGDIVVTSDVPLAADVVQKAVQPSVTGASYLMTSAFKGGWRPEIFLNNCVLPAWIQVAPNRTVLKTLRRLRINWTAWSPKH